MGSVPEREARIGAHGSVSRRAFTAVSAGLYRSQRGTDCELAHNLRATWGRQLSSWPAAFRSMCSLVLPLCSLCNDSVTRRPRERLEAKVGLSRSTRERERQARVGAVTTVEAGRARLTGRRVEGLAGGLRRLPSQPGACGEATPKRAHFDDRRDSEDGDGDSSRAFPPRPAQQAVSYATGSVQRGLTLRRSASGSGRTQTPPLKFACRSCFSRHACSPCFALSRD